MPAQTSSHPGPYLPAKPHRGPRRPPLGLCRLSSPVKRCLAPPPASPERGSPERTPTGACVPPRPRGGQRRPAGPVLADTAGETSSPHASRGGRRGHPSLRHGHHFVGYEREDRPSPGRAPAPVGSYGGRETAGAGTERRRFPALGHGPQAAASGADGPGGCFPPAPSPSTGAARSHCARPTPTPLRTSRAA